MGKYFVLFFIIHLITLVESFTKSCNASLQTVSTVAGCPTGDTSYKKAAQQKNCSSLPMDRSNCDSFEYHCVLSEDLKTAIEVCAPSLFIVGHVCAMFSNTLQSIMRVDNMTCGNNTVGCPYSYNSTTSFRYQQCFPTEKQLYTTEATKRSSSSSTKGEMKERSNDMNFVIIIIVVVIFGCTVITLVLIYLKRRYRRRQVQLQITELKETKTIEPQTNKVNQHLPQPRGENESQNNDNQLDNPEIQPLLDVTDEPGPKGLPVVEETIVDPVDVPDDGNGEEEKVESILDAFSVTPNEFPAYKNFKTREKSFDESYGSMKKRALEFARDGFFYEGYGGATSCFHCGCFKDNWTDLDDVHKEHLELDKKCHFLKYVQSNIIKT